MKLAKGSKSFILSALTPAVIFFILGFIFINFISGFVLILLSVCLFILTCFFIIFFRDPDREIGKDFIASADGKIRDIYDIDDKDIGNSICISTFMNIQNVHVNRLSYDGKIEKIDHIYGTHLPAFKKESEKNERTIIIVDSDIGRYKIIQIAGTLARRIVTYVKKGDIVKKGDRIGMIRLGSRVDLYIPKNPKFDVCVKIGDKIKAGESRLAKINA